MPVAYPFHFRSILKAGKSRSQPAAFSLSEPRRGFAYAQAIGTDIPVFWDVAFRFTRTEAVAFQLWFKVVLSRGADEFTMSLRTEFGMVEHTCRFLPDSLLPAAENGDTWGYTATVMARALVIPGSYEDAAELIVGLPDWPAWIGMLDETVSREMPSEAGPRSVANLFSTGIGAWLDVSDLSTLFTDTAGATPPTSYGQALARVNDRSGAGAHALQASAGQRPLLRRSPVGGLRNLLTYSEEIGNAAWSGAASVTADTTSDPGGVVTADTLTDGSGAASNNRNRTLTVPNGTSSYTASSYVLKTSGGTSPTFAIYMSLTGGTTVQSTVFLNTDTGAISGANASVSSVGNYWRFSNKVTNNGSGNTTLAVNFYPAQDVNGSYTVNAAATGSAVVSWSQVELATLPSAYQRVVQANNATEAGKADVHSLVFDGIDDAMSLTFASALGAGCTVGVSIPDVGASIATGVTIGATYTLSQSAAALVIINRALSIAETSDLEAYLNAAAGV